ncbi:hypothetical protein Tco_0401367 [Tanacetum coccineum]
MLTITLIESSSSLAYLISRESLKTQSCFEFSPSLLLEPQKDGYCPPSITAKQIEDIHNFKQEGDESLYQAWEWYNNLLYKCPTHDINSHQKIRPDESLIAIQTMADHSQKWHDGSTSRNIESSSSKDGLAALVNKLDNLGRDMNKLKESVHVK